jgi:putative serine protease PepD
MSDTEVREPDVIAPPPKPRRGGWIAAALLATMLAFVSGFYVREATTPPEPTPTPTPADPAAEVAKLILPTAVLIRAGDSLGSGFIYNTDGRIFTAAHVVGTTTDVTVRLADGTPLKGKVLGRDEARDVAVVKVKHKGLKAAKLAKGVRLQVGQLAVAVGSPFGMRETVTSGIVSGTGRTLATPGGAVDAIQTDAAINPGNSGGPLVDRQGRVIGINVAKDGAGRDSVGLAVPIDVAIHAATYLEKGKSPPPVAFLGIQGTEPAEAESGALVVDVQDGGPADDAGLKNGDRITAIDKKKIPGMPELAAEIRKHVPGDTVTLTYVRDGKTKTVKVKLGSFNEQ